MRAMNRDYIKKQQACSCIEVATMTLAGADDDATMGKAELMIPVAYSNVSLVNCLLSTCA